MKFQINISLFIFLYLCVGYSHVLCQLTTPIRVVPSPSPAPGPSPVPKIDFRTLVEQKLQNFATMKPVNGKREEVRMNLKEVCPIDESKVAARIFSEYGAIYMAKEVAPIPRCIFSAEYQVQAFQSSVKKITYTLDGVSITLQQPAMDALIKAREEAVQLKLVISPRGGSLAAMRSYEDTRRLWNTRFLPGLNYWVKRGELKKTDADAAKRLPVEDQVRLVLEWEGRNMYFSKDFSKSILYSVAAPGASQHISMLAIDIQQFGDSRVREILAKHGWFQTVKSDLPHFTYLGWDESELPSKGLKLELVGTQKFWIPDLKQ